MKKLIVAGLLMGCASVQAYEDSIAKSLYANDLVTCGIFFSLASDGLKKANDTQAADTYGQVSEIFMGASERIMGMDLTEARAEAAASTLQAEMGYNYDNFNRLIKKYGDLCMGLAKEPKKRFLYWQAK